MSKNKRKRGHQSKSEVLVTKKKSVIKNLRAVDKSNGLLVGTNCVLRSLERKQLSAVFLCSDKACTPIFRAVSFWCKETDVPLFTLEGEEKHFLNPKIPLSVTYGIKKDCVHLHPELEESLKQITVSKDHEVASNFEPVSNFNDLKDSSSKNVPKEEERERFLCHKKHTKTVKKSKLKIEAQRDFLALCSSSDSEEEFVTSKCYLNDLEFPEYKSVKWKNSELIIK